MLVGMRYMHFIVFHLWVCLNLDRLSLVHYLIPFRKLDKVSIVSTICFICLTIGILIIMGFAPSWRSKNKAYKKVRSSNETCIIIGWALSRDLAAMETSYILKLESHLCSYVGSSEWRFGKRMRVFYGSHFQMLHFMVETFNTPRL